MPYMRILAYLKHSFGIDRSTRPTKFRTRKQLSCCANSIKKKDKVSDTAAVRPVISSRRIVRMCISEL